MAAMPTQEAMRLTALQPIVREDVVGSELQEGRAVAPVVTLDPSEAAPARASKVAAALGPGSSVGRQRDGATVVTTATPIEPPTVARDKISYYLTRIVFLRAFGAIYFIAFLIAWNQNEALLGEHGLLPACSYLSKVGRKVPGPLWARVQALPTVLWLTGCSDHLLQGVAAVGLVLSATVVLLGAANVPIMAALWVLYHSLVNVGQTWYSFGWESQVLEMGFLAIFMVPLLSLSQLPKNSPTPWIAVWGYRWLVFRIMLGAGLIKVRGDQCWHDLTCMVYHYETQPVPNPAAWYFHMQPLWFQMFGTLVNHFVELIAPFMLFMPRYWRALGGFIQIGFQFLIIASGNLSFLNYLTIVPCICAFDDDMLGFLFSRNTRNAVRVLQTEPGEGLKIELPEMPAVPDVLLAQATETTADGLRHRVPERRSPEVHSPVLRNTPIARTHAAPRTRRSVALSTARWTARQIVSVALALLLAWLSIPVVKNLLSSRQEMNTSFDAFRLVNTYGAFGSITKQRTEVILMATNGSNPLTAEWYEYQFPCKPGDVHRRPCQIAPYHYRMDWLMWFAAFQDYQSNPWLVHMAAKILAGDSHVFPFFVQNPFPDPANPPKWVKMEHYEYRYTRATDVPYSDPNVGVWWTRKHLRQYLPAVDLDNLTPFLQHYGWTLPDKD